MTACWSHGASCCSFYILFPFKRPKVENEEELVSVLQELIDKSLNEVSLEAALCLGFLRPRNSMVREFLLLCLCQGPMPQRMKVWEAGSQDPWEVLGKQWPVLTWVQYGPTITSQRKQVSSGHTAQFPVCLWICKYMTVGIYGQISVHTYIYLVWMFIYLYVHTSTCTLIQKAERQKEAPSPYSPLSFRLALKSAWLSAHLWVHHIPCPIPSFTGT